MRHGKDFQGTALLLLTGMLLSGCSSSPLRRNPVVGRQLSLGRGPAAAVPATPRELRMPVEVPSPPVPGPSRPVAAAQGTNPPPAVPGAAAPSRPVPALPTSHPTPLAAQPAVPSDSAAPTAGVPQQAPADPLTSLRTLQRAAAERYAGVDSYIVRVRRREQVRGKDEPEELMLFKFRKEPWSVYMKWIGPEATGREVIYVKGRYENKLHTRLAAGDVPLMPAGKRMALDPNSALVRASSRRPITDAGIGNLVERFTLLVAAQEKGDATRGTLRYHGPLQRPEFPQPCEAVEQIVPPGRDPNLSQGGRRWWFFDAVTRFPTLMIMQDHTSREVEYYFYDRFEFNVRLDDDDFNPDRLWGK